MGNNPHDDAIIADLSRNLNKASVLLNRYVKLFWGLKDAMHLRSAVNFNPSKLPEMIETIRIKKKDYDAYQKMLKIINEFDVSISNE